MFYNTIWYREEDEKTHFSDLSLPENHLVVVGHTPQYNINLKNVNRNRQYPSIVYCDCGKGNLQGFNLTTGSSEDIEILDPQKQVSYIKNRWDNLKTTLNIMNDTFKSIEEAVKEMKPIRQNDIDIILNNQSFLREEQQVKLNEMLPQINRLSNGNIKDNLKLGNFRSQNEAIPIQEQHYSKNASPMHNFPSQR